MLPYITTPFVYASGALGVSPDQLKLVFSFLLSYPLATVFKRIPDSQPGTKNLFSITVSLFYLIGLFDLWSGLRTILIAATGTYALASYLRTSPYMPWLVFFFLMAHLSINQITRQRLGDPGLVDITGAQMVLVMKLSAFAWNVADGALLVKKGKAGMSEFRLDRMVERMPGWLDYAGWVFWFPALMVGPAMDYQEHRRWMDGSMFAVPTTSTTTEVKGGAKTSRSTRTKPRVLPNSTVPALLKLAAGLGWILLYLIFSGSYSVAALQSQTFLKHSASTAPSFLNRVWRMYFTNVVARFQYYGVWCLTEGSCILSGLGYNGVEENGTGKRERWDRCRNIYPWGVETAQNTRAYLEFWNMKTNAWLRNYVYLRVTPVGKKPGFRASMATFVASAIWHGFYPGYYLTFVLASFIQTVAKNFRRYLRPFFLDPQTGTKPTAYKPAYDFFSYLATQLAFSFCTTPFLVLGLSDSLRVWASVYLYAVVGVAVSMGVFASPEVKVWLKKRLEARKRGVISVVGGGEMGNGQVAEKTDSATTTTTTNSTAVEVDGAVGGGSGGGVEQRRPKLVGPGLSSDFQRDLDEMMGEVRGTSARL